MLIGCTTAFRELGVMGPSKHDKTHNTDSFYGQPVKNCSDDSWCVFQIFEILTNSESEIADPRKILRGSAGCRAAAQPVQEGSRQCTGRHLVIMNL